jgi:hypothetical protein
MPLQSWKLQTNLEGFVLQAPLLMLGSILKLLLMTSSHLLSKGPGCPCPRQSSLVVPLLSCAMLLFLALLVNSTDLPVQQHLHLPPLLKGRPHTSLHVLMPGSAGQNA